jgi:hypothetical protein
MLNFFAQKKHQHISISAHQHILKNFSFSHSFFCPYLLEKERSISPMFSERLIAGNLIVPFEK